MAEQIVTLEPGESKTVNFGAIPREAKPYQVSVNSLTGSFEAIGLPPLPGGPYIPIEVVSPDSNNDGKIDSLDEEAFLNALGSVKGDLNYRRCFDINYDGIIDNADRDLFGGYLEAGIDLETIRNRIKTGVLQHLVWPANAFYPEGWEANLVALNKDAVVEFTGQRAYEKEGYITVWHHPAQGAPHNYLCIQYANDTAIASYKALGYGCLLASGSAVHSYILLWTGGDWHDLHNWQVLEPQYGKVWGAADESLPSMYYTQRIFFYSSTNWLAPFYPYIRGASLKVDFASKTVDFDELPGRLARADLMEEPGPSEFDTSLGI